MANKHEACEPDTKPAVWVWSEPDTVWFYVGPDSNMKLGTVGWPGTARLPLSLFFTLKCVYRPA
jgi:hypothetical protein